MKFIIRGHQDFGPINILFKNNGGYNNDRFEVSGQYDFFITPKEFPFKFTENELDETVLLTTSTATIARNMKVKFCYIKMNNGGLSVIVNSTNKRKPETASNLDNEEEPYRRFSMKKINV